MKRTKVWGCNSTSLGFITDETNKTISKMEDKGWEAAKIKIKNNSGENRNMFFGSIIFTKERLEDAS